MITDKEKIKMATDILWPRTSHATSSNAVQTINEVFELLEWGKVPKRFQVKPENGK